MTSTPAARTPLTPLTPATDNDLAVAKPVSPGGPDGWDPYEVWRTRVLLPRLEAQAERSTTIQSATIKPFPSRQP